MGNIVRYNGGTESYYGCSAPTDLVVGKEYEVISQNDCGWQTNYTLKGVTGHFNSCWFDKVTFKKNFMAFANRVPTIGQRFDCNRLEPINNYMVPTSCVTSTVKEVMDIGDNFYKVVTANSIYIVKVE